jgi:hypothetical protein
MRCSRSLYPVRVNFRLNCLAMGERTVVHDPEHPAGAGIRFAGHHLLDEPGEGRDAGSGLAPAGDLSAVDVPAGQVGQGAPAPVVVLDAHRAGLARGQGGVAAAAGLDGGLLIGADDPVASAQPRAPMAIRDLPRQPRRLRRIDLPHRPARRHLPRRPRHRLRCGSPGPRRSPWPARRGTVGLMQQVYR